MTNDRKRRQPSTTLDGAGENATAQEESLSFEAAARRLDEVVSLLESGQQPLEESLRLYEEGMRLAQRCQQMLDDAELRVQRLRINDQQNERETAEFILEAFEIEESE